MQQPGDDWRGPSERQLDHELDELLQELRVMLPGVEVFFAFLLTLPFSARFGEVTILQRNVYFASLLCAALATVFLIAPTAHRRLLLHRNRKAQTLQLANRLAIAGTVLLALASSGVIYVIADVLFGIPIAALVTAVVGGIIGWLWYGWPLYQRRR